MNNTPESKSNPLGEQPVGKLLLQFAIPSIVSTLVGSLYNMVDQVFIGQRIGYLGNAATTVAYPLTFLCGAITLLFSNVSAVNFSILIGRGEKDSALLFAGNGMMLIAFPPGGESYVFHSTSGRSPPAPDRRDVHMASLVCWALASPPGILLSNSLTHSSLQNPAS